ncbi:MAG: formylglycine-generating enzyme family protein [Saprospiraceae bacterium]
MKNSSWSPPGIIRYKARAVNWSSEIGASPIPGRAGLAFLLMVLILSCASDKTTNPAPTGMVLIPAGEFSMGGIAGQADPDEFPVRRIRVSGFYLDAREVTNRQFAEFVKATGYVTTAEQPIDWAEMQKQLPPGTPKPDEALLQPGALVFSPASGPVDLRDYSQWWVWTTGANWRQPEGPGSSIDGRMDHPVVQVSWLDATAYAKWAGNRLPTEVEWEWAARGGKQDPKYPWGNLPASAANKMANYYQGLFPYKNTAADGFSGTAPVGSFPENGYGLFDMAGNVWEWCQDKYHYRAYSLSRSEKVLSDPSGPESSFDPDEPTIPKRVTRGGSFLCDESYCSGYRVSRRMKSSEDSGFNHTGFRCARDLAFSPGAGK